MKHLGIFATLTIGLSAALSVAPGCGSSTSNGTGANTTTTSTGGTGTTSTSATTTTSTSATTTTSTSSTSTMPAPPTLGMQIDRAGRPGVNTALNHSFDANASSAGAAKDAYNQDNDPTKWASNYGGEIAKNLAILDALDGVCGNQILATPGTPVPATRYATLAGALAGDMIWLNTAGPTCTTYLAVEANAVGLMANTDCGGRALTYNVIDVTYSALAVGAFTGVTNGITANDATFSTTFPYLAAPH